MHTATIPRKRQLKAALVLAGKTMEQFCREIGVSESHLNLVLKGEYGTRLTLSGRERASARVDIAVDQFIEQHLNRSAA